MKQYQVTVQYDDVLDEQIVEATGTCGAIMIVLMSLPSGVGSIVVKAKRLQEASTPDLGRNR